MPNTRVNSISVISYNVYYRLYCIIVSVYMPNCLGSMIGCCYSFLICPVASINPSNNHSGLSGGAMKSQVEHLEKHTHSTPKWCSVPSVQCLQSSSKKPSWHFFCLCVCAWIFSQRVTYELVLQRMAHFGCFCSLWSDNIWFYQLPLKKKKLFW